jgi:hypothetical protein
MISQKAERDTHGNRIVAVEYDAHSVVIARYQERNKLLVRHLIEGAKRLV